MIEVKAGSLDYIDLRISKGYDRGLQELVNRWVMFWLTQKKALFMLIQLHQEKKVRTKRKALKSGKTS